MFRNEDDMEHPVFAKLGICFVLSLLTYPLFGQTKFEKEYRVKATEIPEAALTFIKALEVNRKIKWFYEENLVGNSVEAKFKLKQHKYSVEFDTLGQLPDVEIKIPKKEIPTPTWDSIRFQLSSFFSRWKIQKIQVQYSGPIPVLQSLINTKKAPASYSTKYEIVVRGRKDQNDQLYEFLFSSTGQTLERSIIQLRNTDHLEY